MAYANFNEALMSRTLAKQKRKNILAGRDPSEGFEGIMSAGVSGAGERFTRIKQVELEEKRLAESKRRTDLEVAAAERAEKREEKRSRGAKAGMVAGGAIGFYYGGPKGAAVGAGIGGVTGEMFLGDCIIISACTTPNSYEVKIARKFRDKYLGDVTLTGYYRFSISIVPLIKKSKMFKWIVKKALVDSLVKYGEWILQKEEKPSQLTILITEGFLKLCKIIGNRLFLKLEVT